MLNHSHNASCHLTNITVLIDFLRERRKEQESELVSEQKIEIENLNEVPFPLNLPKQLTRSKLT